MSWSTKTPFLIFSILALCMPASTAAQAPGPIPGGRFDLFADAALTTPGLTGSYVNQNLAAVTSPADWRVTQTIAGTRLDPTISFSSTDWIGWSQLGLTGGSSQNWDWFSVQWDGFVSILDEGTVLQTRSDDSSRMWIDLDGNGLFTNAFPELVNNHWGAAQALTTGDPSPPLPVGTYRIRLQYEERSGSNQMHLTSEPPPTVRIAYLIPVNRTPQPNAVPTIRAAADAWQTWLCDQTERNLGAPSRLRFETDAVGAIEVHVVNVGATDAYLLGDIWSRCIQEATNAGVPVWTRGQIWLLIPEIHVMLPNGTIQGGVALGSGGGGDDAGVAMLNSVGIALAAQPGGITNTTLYHGMVLPAVGLYPLVQGVSFPWFEGDTISSVVSSWYGAGMHELGHALGLGHDPRNDANFNGNLMYNGLRGFRGALHPNLFPNDDCRLEFASALVLRTSRYTTSCGQRWPATGAVTVDRTPPQVTITSQGSVLPVAGLLPIAVQVSDDRGLATLLLAKEGETVEERPLGGTSASITVQTAWYDPGQARTYQVTVLDAAGNRAIASSTITAVAGPNRAPQPFFRVTPPSVARGATAVLSAVGSQDPEGGALLYEWDLDGTGTYTPQSTSPQRQVSWLDPWPRLVSLRVTDPLGARTVSTSIAVRVRPADEGPFHSVLGVGTGGCNGPVKLRANLQPGVGNAAFALVSTNAPPATIGLVILAAQGTTACTNIPGLFATCFHFVPASLVDFASIASDAAGHSTVPVPIPANPGLIGLQLLIQTLWVDGGPCQFPAPRFATSNGLLLQVF